jgi:enamine deaminase RidA (YjgF/YER057c/UK114 family)
MAEQTQIAIGNLTKVLESAGMTMANVVRLTIFTTDVDELLAAYGTAAEFLGNNLPAMSLVGVTWLAVARRQVRFAVATGKAQIGDDQAARRR